MANQETGNGPSPPQPKWIVRSIQKIECYFHDRHTAKKQEGPQDRASRRTANATVWIAALTLAVVFVGSLQYLIFKAQLKVMADQLIEMKGTGAQTDQIIEANKKLAEAAIKSADAARQSADSTVALERPTFFVLVKVEGAVPKEGPFDSVATPSLSYTVTNLGRVPGILRTAYVRCYLQREKFPERPIVDTSQLHLAQNAIAAGLTGTGYPPCQFEKPFSKQDWLDIANSKAIPVYAAILIYEGPLDYTYVDTVSYRIDPFNGGGTYPLGIQHYTNEQTSTGRVSKGASLDLPNIIWKPETPPQSK